MEKIDNMSDDFPPKGKKILPRQFERDVASAFKKIETQYEQKKQFPHRYVTGFNSLDQIISGFYPEELILLTGQPGIGKTAFLCSLACKKSLIDTPNQETILYFTHKDSRMVLTTRMFAAIEKVPLLDVIMGIRPSQWPNMARACGILGILNITIIDFSFNLQEIEATLIEVVKKNDLRLVIIDDLQFIKNTQEEAVAGSRERELADILVRLKKMAQIAQVPIVIVAPSNTDGGLVLNRLIRNYNMQESSLFESAADKILRLHRPEYYSKHNPAQEIAEIIVTKNNMGCTGTVELAFCGPSLCFEDFGTTATTALRKIQQIISQELHNSGNNT
jgi:replicative DNA helicase